MTSRLIHRDDDSVVFERVVLSEVLVPNVANTFADIYTEEAIKEFCYQYALQGYGLDIEHDGVDVQGLKYVVVESFIARPGDPDFIEGSWVVGVKVLDDDLWQDVLDGKINGFSFEAQCNLDPITITYEDDSWVTSGVTEPDPVDGHTHVYTVVIGPLNKVISGGTGVTNGHSHSITTHTITGESSGHLHRYQVLGDDDDEEDD